MYTYFFDIETSTIKCDNKEKIQVTYLTNLLKANYETMEIVDSIFFRTIGESIEYIKTNITEPSIIWCHNLDYELTFILRELGESNAYINEKGKNACILRDKHSPLQITLDYLPNITFRDTYAIFNKTIKQMGDELNIPKLDYDYKVTRLPWDDLEQHDYDYNERDNVIACKYLFQYMTNHDIPFEKIPLTFTSEVKIARKEFIQKEFGDYEYKKYYFHRNNLYNTYEFFNMCLETYQGGLTTCNRFLTNKLIEKTVYSIDIKSSYPNQLCTKQYPVFSKKCTQHFEGNKANENFRYYKWFIGRFTFSNLRIKDDNYLLALSKFHIHKCIQIGGGLVQEGKYFNGKFISGKYVTLYANNVDMELINLLYDYDNLVCDELYVTTESRYLRYSEVAFLLNSFQLKEESIKDSFDYVLSKVRINAQYGIKVTCPIRSEFNIEEGEILEVEFGDMTEKERQLRFEQLQNQGLFRGSIDIYSDGIYVTSYAKLQLCEMMKTIVDLEGNVIYCDTDSLKFYSDNNIDGILDYIENWNRKKIRENSRNRNFRQYKKDFNVSRETYNKLLNLGIWEVEYKNTSTIFKTLGAKKYIYYTLDGKIKSTIAGCNKKNIPPVFEKLAENYNLSIAETIDTFFTVGVTFNTEVSGRTVAYRENRLRSDMDLFTYKGRFIGQYGGIIITDTTYTLGMSESDKDILDLNHDNNNFVVCTINKEGMVSFGKN